VEMLCTVPVMGVVVCVGAAAAALPTCANKTARTSRTLARSFVLDILLSFQNNYRLSHK
jgi:hypothetical protein